MSAIEVSEALLSDARMLSELHGQAMKRAWEAEEMARLLAESHICALIAREGAKAQGFVMASFAADEAEILMLAVIPLARRRGLGSKLMLAASALAQKRGVTKLFLEVSEDNAPARRLYANLAFHEVGRRPRYYMRDLTPPVDALILEKVLRSGGFKDEECA